MRTLLAIAAFLLSIVRADTASLAPGSALLGVYYGNQGWNIEQLQAMESWLQKPHAVVVLFTNWDGSPKTMDNLFLRQLPAVWQNGNVPLVTWEPYLRGSTPQDIEQRIANGLYDGYVMGWAARLKTYLSGPDGRFDTADDRRAYLRLAHEMNGNWYPWAAGGETTPGDYVRMWQRVHSHFDAIGLGPRHVQWIWSVNHVDVGGHTAEDYFPGDAWIDWIGVDGYNWGASEPWSSWTVPSAVFESMTSRLRALSVRPLAIAETGTTTSGGTVALKSSWIADLFSWAASVDVRLICYFNEDKETDWAVFGGSGGDGTYKYRRTTYRVYSAYAAAARQPALLSPVRSNPRLLTDDEFAGR